MEAIFLCEKPDKCRTVYASALPELREVAGLEDAVYE